MNDLTGNKQTNPNPEKKRMPLEILPSTQLQKVKTSQVKKRRRRNGT